MNQSDRSSTFGGRRTTAVRQSLAPLSLEGRKTNVRKTTLVNARDTRPTTVGRGPTVAKQTQSANVDPKDVDEAKRTITEYVKSTELKVSMTTKNKQTTPDFDKMPFNDICKIAEHAIQDSFEDFSFNPNPKPVAKGRQNDNLEQSLTVYKKILQYFDFPYYSKVEQHLQASKKGMAYLNSQAKNWIVYSLGFIVDAGQSLQDDEILPDRRQTRFTSHTAMPTTTTPFGGKRYMSTPTRMGTLRFQTQYNPSDEEDEIELISVEDFFHWNSSGFLRFLSHEEDHAQPFLNFLDSQHQAKMQVLEADSEKIMKETENLFIACKEMENDAGHLDSTEQNLRRIIGAVQDLKEKTTTFETQISKFTEGISAFHSKIQLLDNRKKELNALIRELELTVTQQPFTREDVESMSKECDSLANTLSTQKYDQHKTERRLADLQSETADTLKDLSELKERVNRMGVALKMTPIRAKNSGQRDLSVNISERLVPKVGVVGEFWKHPVVLGKLEEIKAQAVAVKLAYSEQKPHKFKAMTNETTELSNDELRTHRLRDQKTKLDEKIEAYTNQKSQSVEFVEKKVKELGQRKIELEHKFENKTRKVKGMEDSSAEALTLIHERIQKRQQERAEEIKLEEQRTRRCLSIIQKTADTLENNNDNLKLYTAQKQQEVRSLITQQIALPGRGH
ncbi:hypothetical protein BLNAU_11921 [Blattamonas nauphoetae]|uniref:Uncharacterized protein n=1 Tax=Blattamonas nauphoetae TaxID=2049346 RepID=A0ABQ9XNQ6_9EUKA|nr:hypothetical protein BLNAU_11921 [Blattamonas nauphoetae]